MTAAQAGVRIPRDIALSPLRQDGDQVTVGQTFSEGWMLMRDGVAGTLQVATEAPGLLTGGFATRDFYVAAVSGDFCNVLVGIRSVVMSTLSGDSFTDTSGPAPIYAIDNNTFGALAVNPSSGAARSICGCFLRLDPKNSARCIAWIGPEGVAMAQALQAAQGTSTRDRVRGVLTSLGGATTYASGVLTGPANTAFPTQDGIAPAVGDVYFAPKGLTNLPAAAQAGPWQLLAAGSGSSQWVATRPWWYQTGTAIPLCAEIRVGPEGTAWAGNTWRSTAASGAGNVDTADPHFYPRFQRGTQALTAGAATVSNLWIAPGAVPSLVDTTEAAAVKGVTTAGEGSGSLALTGTSTDIIAYQYTNF